MNVSFLVLEFAHDQSSTELYYILVCSSGESWRYNTIDSRQSHRVWTELNPILVKL